jgi:hypothetical protein
MARVKEKRTNFTVGPSRKGGWRGMAEGSDRAVATGSNKAEVVRATIIKAKRRQPSSVRIQGRDGRFQEERSYGRDPTRTPG